MFSFVRHRHADSLARDDTVFAAFNFSAQEQTVTLGEVPYPGTYRDAFTGDAVELSTLAELTLPGWGHRVLIRCGR